MGISSAMDWWEEWQLRILVLGSLFVQLLLFFSAPFRKYAIPSWSRSIIWLSYQGSDALAIYALATLFSRQSKRDYSSAQGYSILEVVWAPILLMHLGGQDCITAYNIEDNELWTRHVLTAVSQITVAIYVFCKSWPGGDKRLLQAAILLFTPGILKCLEKPLALKSACFNTLVSLSPASRSRKASRRDEAISLEEYVQKARAFHADHQCQVQEECHVPQAQGEPNEVDLEGNRVRQAQGEEDESSHRDQIREKKRLQLEAHKLFADLASPYPDRLAGIKSFLVHGDDQHAYDSLQKGLFDTFDRLYTKWKFASMFQPIDMIISGRSGREEIDQVTSAPEEIDKESSVPEEIEPETSARKEIAQEGVKAMLKAIGPIYVRTAAMYLPFVAIGLFHNSHREGYNVHDVKVTYVLLCCTAVLEFISTNINMRQQQFQLRVLGGVAQYSLVGFFANNKKHTKMMCSSSFRITVLVLGHVKGWWMEHITDVASYWRFNDNKGQWTIQHQGCDQEQDWGLNRPLDEGVLLWHIATDLCFYQKVGTSVRHAKATGCREISNYMIYLLFANPEMLLSGTRRNLFMEANAELEEILMNDKPLLKKILKGDKPSLMETLKGNKSIFAFLKGKGPSSAEIERGFMQRIIAKLQATDHKEEDIGYTELPMEAEQCPSAQEGLIQDAWKISKALLALGDEKMWEVIEGVWVEMLCFSASRCRGYLHAKSMGSGVELLSYVWFLLSRMGMETLPGRLQRTEHSSAGGNAGAASSTSMVSATTGQVIP
ncbi:unnamed protein product [Alopecurus aequalis]